MGHESLAIGSVRPIRTCTKHHVLTEGKCLGVDAASEPVSLGAGVEADLTEVSVGSWEPSLDTELWEKENELHLFVQHVGQGDGETTEDIPPQMVYILEWKPY